MFRSAHEALQFAYRISGVPIVKMSSVNSMRGASGGGDLNPYERHAQAAMILACVERQVDLTETAYLRAHFGKELFSGQYERIITDILFRAVIGAMGTGVYSRRGVQKLILNFFGKDIPMSAIRRDLQCSLDNANKKRNQVYDALSDLGVRAERNAENALCCAGLIND